MGAQPDNTRNNQIANPEWLTPDEYYSDSDEASDTVEETGGDADEGNMSEFVDRLAEEHGLSPANKATLQELSQLSMRHMLIFLVALALKREERDQSRSQA